MKRITSLFLALILILSISTSFALETYSVAVEQFMLACDMLITDRHGEPYDTDVIDDSKVVPVGMIYYAFDISGAPGQGLIALIYNGESKFWLAPEIKLLGSIMAIKKLYDVTEITDGFIIIKDAAKL